MSAQVQLGMGGIKEKGKLEGRISEMVSWMCPVSNYEGNKGKIYLSCPFLAQRQ